MPRPSRLARATALTLLVATAALSGTQAVAAPGAAAPPPAPSAQDVAALQRQVAALADELSAAVLAYENQQIALDGALQADYEAKTENEVAASRVVTAQRALNASVSLAYRTPAAPDLLLFVAKGQQAYDTKRTLDKALGRSAAARQSAVDALVLAKATAQEGADQRRALTVQAQQQQRDVDATLAGLRDRAAAGQAALE
ncbi:MAG: hypothetical protein JWL64_2106, partial [Frankiales bacterium]|nr:hypothetical protein [Frankiales bacterium]